MMAEWTAGGLNPTRKRQHMVRNTAHMLRMLRLVKVRFVILVNLPYINPLRFFQGSPFLVIGTFPSPEIRHHPLT